MSRRPAWTLDRRPLGETPPAGALFSPRGANERGVAFPAPSIKYIWRQAQTESHLKDDVSAARKRTVQNSTVSNQAIGSNCISRDVWGMRRGA